MRLQLIDRDALSAAADDVVLTDDGAPAPKRRQWVLAVENAPTGDGRFYQAGAFTWRDLPLPFMATDVTAFGHDGAVLVANLVEIARVGDDIVGTTEDIVPDEPESESAQRVRYLQGLMDNGDLRGVSVDMDQIEGFLVVDGTEMEMPEPDEDGNLRIPLTNERAEFSAARIIGATALPFPAFMEAGQAIAASGLLTGEANIPVTPQPNPQAATADDVALVEGALAENPEALEAFGRIMADVEIEEAPAEDEGEEVLVAAIDPPTAPPMSWFAKPEGDCMSHTCTDEGQVWGRLALWNQCHIGVANDCVLAPRSAADYRAFLTGELVTAEGERVRVGQITVDAGHADKSLGARPAKEHYDHTGWVAADVTIGEDEHGIWYAGAMRPDLDEHRQRKFLAADVSGDWRRIGSNLELVAIASVNVPGFPKMEAMVAGGEVQTLVLTVDDCDGLRATRERIAASIGRHPLQLAAARQEVAARIGRSHRDRRNAAIRRVKGMPSRTG